METTSTNDHVIHPQRFIQTNQLFRSMLDILKLSDENILHPRTIPRDVIISPNDSYFTDGDQLTSNQACMDYIGIVDIITEMISEQRVIIRDAHKYCDIKATDKTLRSRIDIAFIKRIPKTPIIQQACQITLQCVREFRLTITTRLQQKLQTLKTGIVSLSISEDEKIIELLDEIIIQLTKEPYIEEESSNDARSDLLGEAQTIKEIIIEQIIWHENNERRHIYSNSKSWLNGEISHECWAQIHGTHLTAQYLTISDRSSLLYRMYSNEADCDIWADSMNNLFFGASNLSDFIEPYVKKSDLLSFCNLTVRKLTHFKEKCSSDSQDTKNLEHKSPGGNPFANPWMHNVLDGTAYIPKLVDIVQKIPGADIPISQTHQFIEYFEQVVWIFANEEMNVQRGNQEDIRYRRAKRIKTHEE